jgi:hypothetical protein
MSAVNKKCTSLNELPTTTDCESSEREVIEDAPASKRIQFTSKGNTRYS